ncbi:MAG: trypsin-like peptidase domain-containing protein [Rhodoferax sp.]|jgi:hypothetical protein|uniref:trypsin-like peptidase domain-containing protein n=1 Tax=Rhodoferax sp. TaxID=50421 RepID=UPI001B70599A|nr:serine protease [Rhodoferax sp.]MBP9147434.1 trypsin-like peptidase domain-containing protein [Rhodoferax sp.]MBP9736403.1 trypsin-like peptidase domain-containing protein [Rhodoferax sp.]
MQVSTIAEQLFFTTIRIDTIAANGGQGSGTGFLFLHKVGEQGFPFVVTNKHVVNGMKSGALTFLQRDGQAPRLGQGYRLAIEGWPDAWFGHPLPDIDIAVCPFAPLEAHIKQQSNMDLFYRWVDSNMIPNEEKLKGLDAIESVTFIGYPNGIWDSKNLLPVARRGTTASPIEVDFEGTPRFLVDASVFGGSSGSPVFILNQGSWAEKNGGLVAGSRLMFVGVIAAVFLRKQWNEIVAVPIPTASKPMVQNEEMIDLGIVFKARTVVETIEAFLKTHNGDPSASAASSTPAPQSE